MKWTKHMSEHYCVDPDAYREIRFDISVMQRLRSKSLNIDKAFSTQGRVQDFDAFDLSFFRDFDEAYHQLISVIVEKQAFSTGLVIGKTGVSDIFVDGGFSKNDVYMHLRAEAFPDHRLHAANVPQASALGSAIIMHDCWNKEDIPKELVETRQIQRADKNQHRT
jgi:sugar (pentulose or hexulose) kinase